MVDDEVDRHQRIDLLRVAAERGHRVAHRREIDHGRNAGEVLHQHAGRAIGDLDAGRALVGQPAGDGLDVLLGDRAAVLVAQQVFEQHLHRIGQLGNAGQAVLLGLDQAVIDIFRGSPTLRVRRQLKLSSDFGHVRSHPGLFGLNGNGRLGMLITRKGAGTVISAVRSRATRPFEAARVLVRRKFGFHADRWRGCFGYREFPGRVLDRRKVIFRCGAHGATRAFGNGGRMRLIAENLGGERGGEPVFSGIDLSLGEGESLVVTGPNGVGQIDAAARDRRTAAGGRGQRAARGRRRGFPPRLPRPATISATSTR